MIDLPSGPFDFVMSDPPWHFKGNSKANPGRNAMRHYSTMTIDEIAKMPVKSICAKDCLLWLWTTNAMVPQALEVMSAWGFKFSTMGHWVKLRADGSLAIGTGLRLRNCGEPFIIAKRGNPKTERNIPSVIHGLRRAHSQKPEEGYDAAERMMPSARRLDMFSRTTRAGWTAFGDEAGKLDEIDDSFPDHIFEDAA